MGPGVKLILAPIVRGRKGEYRKEIDDLRKQGFTKIKLNGTIVDLAEEIVIDKNKKHEIDVIIDRITIRDGVERTALRGGGTGPAESKRYRQNRDR